MTTPRRIMAFRLSSLGDVAMAYPVIKTLSETHPGLEILFVSRPFYAPIFEHLPSVRFIPADVDNTYKGWKGLYRLFKTLKKENPQLFADLHDVLRSKIIRTFFMPAVFPSR